MRILHIGKYYPPFSGGIEHFCADIAEAGAAAGDQVAVLAHHHQAARRFSREIRNGVEVLRAPVYGRLAFAPLSPGFGYRLARAVASFKPDLLHIHMPNVSAFWALLLPACRKLPWVVHWHADVLGAAPSRMVKGLYPVYRPFEQALLRRAGIIVATSPNYLASSDPLRPHRDKCAVVPLTLNEQRLPRTATVQPPPAGDRLRLLCIGRLTYYKGHRTLLQAMDLLARRHAGAVQLDIVGEGEEEARLQRLVGERGLERMVTFRGRLPAADLAESLARCDLLCLPSIERTEAFGLVLLEAMAFGKPALVTDVPGSGMSWVVRDGVTGLVAAAGDPLSLAEKLAWALAHKDKLREMGDNARLRFDQAFSPTAVVGRMSGIYRDLLSRNEE